MSSGGVRNGTENNEHENVNNWTHQVRNKNIKYLIFIEIDHNY